MIDIVLTDLPIHNLGERGDQRSGATGAIVSFVGVARNSSNENPNTPVVRLDYEAYRPMAERELRAIADECVQRFGALRVVVHHRLGILEIGETAVAIQVESSHRSQAFDGCRYVIEEIKKRVPIWKREVYTDGSTWVNAHP